MQDTSKIKEKIISIIKSKGPNFPSPIASEIQTSILFTSAFLSELLSEKQIKITNMKVGSSPIYFIPGQEEQLENFAKKYLKSKEKDAFILLQENKILKDKEQNPAIRVALRSIKDFAIPEEKNNEIYWKYFLTKEEIPEQKNEITKETTTEPEKKELEIFDKESKKEDTPKEQPPEKTETKKTIKKKNSKKSSKADEKFFNKIKEYLSENQIEISDIIGFSKSDLTLKVKDSEKEYLLIAYNKKRLGEKEITDAFKKSEEQKLDYSILSLGEPTKKMNNFIEAIKKIKEIKKIKD
jgi:hypothetical protein